MDEAEIRAELGEMLAERVELEAVRDRILPLLLDPDCEPAVYRTAWALLARRDRPGLEVVVDALAATSTGTRGLLTDAACDFRIIGLEGRDSELRAHLEHMTATGDPSRRGAAAGLLAAFDQGPA